MGQDFEAPEELWCGELVRVDSFGPPDIQVNNIKRLNEVLNLLKEILLTVFFHEVLLLLKSRRILMALQLSRKSVDENRKHLVVGLDISQRQVRTQLWSCLAVIDVLSLGDYFFDLSQREHAFYRWVVECLGWLYELWAFSDLAVDVLDQTVRVGFKSFVHLIFYLKSLSLISISKFGLLN